jgi:LuxR family transcriptional regulator, maltose regulon positive regulatory protein
VIASMPEAWFAVVVDRLARDDVEAARHWMDRILLADRRRNRPLRRARPCRQEAELHCVRLWHGLLGLEDLDRAVEDARPTAAAVRCLDHVGLDDATTCAVLLQVLGAAESWAGDLRSSERNLAAAIEMSANLGLTGLETTAMSYLAMAEYAAGREQSSVELASRALALVATTESSVRRFVEARSGLALSLCHLTDLTRRPDRAAAWCAADLPHGDLFSRFWGRILDARLALLAGSVPNAERLLTAPGDTPRLDESQLPTHLRVASLLERALQATLGADQVTLTEIEDTLDLIGLRGETELVAGWRLQVQGDVRAALANLSSAATHATVAQPPAAALARAHQAQLLDGLGHPDQALAALAVAAAATEGRRNAVPFQGWSRQGTPMASLLPRLAAGSRSRWTQDLARALRTQPDLAIRLAPRTPSPRERVSAPVPTTEPQLSPREREVLTELARGATYADIAAELYLSENTVKSHISNLYGKLGAARRSEALAVARNHHLL